MAFQINPNIPLQAMDNPINIGDAFTKAQSYQAKRLELDRLREQFNEEKEARLRQKQMQQGIASELQKLQQGTPAQYNTTFPQTMPTGQMPQTMTGVLARPQGMTGVLASERGQNLPTPDLFGENILKGNFDVRRELVSPAVAPKQPDIKDVLTAQFNAAMAAQDVETAFDAAKKLKELEKNPTKYFGGLTKGVDPKTNKPLFLAMTESGVVPVDGYQPYEEPKTPKTSLIITSKGYEVVKEGELPKGAPVVATKERELNKPVYDPVERTRAVANAKAEAKIRQDLVADAAATTKTYANTMPILKKAKNIISRLPPDAWQFYFQSKIAGTPLSKYIGNEDQQKAIAELDVLQENLRLKAEKPPGAVSNFEMGILSKAMGVLKENTSPSQKAAAFQTIIDVLENDNKTAINILKQNNASDFAYKGGEFLNRFTNKASREQRKEYLDAYMQVKNDPELLKELQENARDLGVLE